MGMAITAPRYTVHDLERFPNDGNRYELLDGTLLVTPSPGSGHQGIAVQLVVLLSSVLRQFGVARMFSPGVIRSGPLTQLEPDLLVVPARFRPGIAWDAISEHWLAVEIFSPSSRVYDREFKRDAYIALGVREVWLVDLQEKSVETCCARGPGAVVRGSLRWRVPELDLDVTLDLDELFADLV